MADEIRVEYAFICDIDKPHIFTWAVTPSTPSVETIFAAARRPAAEKLPDGAPEKGCAPENVKRISRSSKAMICLDCGGVADGHVLGRCRLPTGVAGHRDRQLLGNSFQRRQER
jgi:hypothetical protein